MPRKKDESDTRVTYDMTRFNFQNRRPNRLTVIIGKRDAGKTMWMLYLAMQSEWREVGFVIVIARTEKSRALWRQIAPHAAVFGPSHLILRQIQQKQEANIRKYEEAGMNMPRELHGSIYIDDCGYNKDFMRCQEMVELVSNSRQWNVDCTISFQHWNNFIPDGRENVDEIFLLATGSQRLISEIRDDFVSCADKDHFIKLVNTFTQNFGAFVIRNKGGLRVEDFCFAANIPKHLLMQVIDDQGETKTVFREMLKIGNVWQHQFLLERAVHNTTGVNSHVSSSSSSSDRCVIKDEAVEEGEEGEDEINNDPPIVFHTTDKCGRSLQIRCVDNKCKRD